MKMKVLLPTDFSSNAKYAIDYAVQLFENEKVEFYLWHVVRASTYITDDIISVKPSASIYDSVISSTKNAIEGLKEDIIAQFNNPKHTFTIRLDYDNFLDAFNQVVALENIDLIVMGTKGSSNLEKTIFGSNTMHAIQQCLRPVLAVPNAYTFKPIKKIAFTTNYNTHYQANLFKISKKIVQIHHAETTILHVFSGTELTESQKQNKKNLDTILREIPHRFVDLDSDEVFTAIHNYIEENNMQLLCITNAKHRFFDRLFVKTHVKKELANIAIPVLVMAR